MPSKRQPSKQRRAAENRARRNALAARTTRASEPRSSRPSGGDEPDAAGKVTARRSTRPAAPATPSPMSASGLADMLGLRGRGRPTPGARAVLVSLVLAVISFGALLFQKTDVDDRGDPVPVQFGGVYLEARSLLTGESVEATKESIISAHGAGVVALVAVPLLVCAVALVAFWRSPTSKPLTIGMLALAATVIFTGGLGIFYMPSLIAMAVGSFQVRRVEMPARMAERAAQQAERAKARDEDDDEPQDDVYDEDAEYEDAVDEDAEYEDDEYEDEDDDEDAETEYDDEDAETEDADEEYETIGDEDDEEVASEDAELDEPDEAADAESVEDEADSKPRQ